MDTNFILSLVFIFSSSLAGSLHCGAMCGSFSCLATKIKNKSNPLRNQFLFHLGRLCTYAILSLGLYSGTKFISFISNTPLIGVALLILILLLILIQMFSEFIKIKNTSFLNKKLNKIRLISTKISTYIFNFITSNNKKETLNSYALGFATGLIPCGWLYMYIAIAGTKQNQLEVILTIFAFWLGTIPILSIIGLFSYKFLNFTIPQSKYISRILLISAAIISINMRVPIFSIFSTADCYFCVSNSSNETKETK